MKAALQDERLEAGGQLHRRIFESAPALYKSAWTSPVVWSEE